MISPAVGAKTTLEDIVLDLITPDSGILAVAHDLFRGQRIGMAKALYHNADFIVFDEAKSALDNLTEAEAMSAIDALPEDKTVLIIAYLLSTVKRCDRIIVSDKGRHEHQIACGH